MAGLRPDSGTFGLLLFMIRLCGMIKHERLVCGQRPSCGGGASSLLSEFGASPVRLRTKTEFSITSEPPELVPEYPSAELVPTSRDSTVPHTRWHAPT